MPDPQPADGDDTARQAAEAWVRRVAAGSYPTLIATTQNLPHLVAVIDRLRAENVALRARGEAARRVVLTYLSPDLEDPGHLDVALDALVAAYGEGTSRG